MDSQADIDVKWIKIENSTEIDHKENINVKHIKIEESTIYNDADVDAALTPVKSELSQYGQKTGTTEVNETPEQTSTFEVTIDSETISSIVLSETISDSLYTCDACLGEFKDMLILKHHIRSVHTARYCNDVQERVPVGSESLLSSHKARHDLNTGNNNYVEHIMHRQHHTSTENKEKGDDGEKDTGFLIEGSPCGTKDVVQQCKLTDNKTTDNANKQRRIVGKSKRARAYQCTLCDFKSSKSSGLDRHMMMTHKGEKPFECTLCEYKTEKRSNFKVHVRTHTGDKPYQCSLCDFKSAHRTGLRRHMVTHTGDQPFECNLCDYKCGLSFHLERHKLTHTEKRPYECEKCDCKFKSICALKRHHNTFTHTGIK